MVNVLYHTDSHSVLPWQWSVAHYTQTSVSLFISPVRLGSLTMYTTELHNLSSERTHTSQSLQCTESTDWYSGLAVIRSL